MCIDKGLVTAMLLLLLLLTPPGAFAQSTSADGPYSQQIDLPGRPEVPDSEEHRRFVEEHSFTYPSYRRKQGEGSGAAEVRPVQGTKQVRIIYLVPSDKSARADYQNATANAISNLQRFYQSQIGGGNTFSIHSPAVEVYQTPHATAFYSTGENARAGGFFESVLADGLALTGGRFNDPNNRWIFYVDADPICGQYIGGNAGVALLAANDLRGLTGQPNVPACSNESPDNRGVNRWIGGLGHELAHAFNVPHPPGCDQGSCTGGQFAANSLMWFGYAAYPNTYLLDENKTQLLATGFFNVLTLDPSAKFNIGGRITSSGNTGLGGATVIIGETQATVVTDVNGNFNFSDLPSGGSYTLSVVKAGLIFTPASVLFNNLDRNREINFSASPTANPIDGTTFFVSQHYRDFLGREPDAAGLAFWTGEIEQCGANLQCYEVKRINVSAAFFLSIEFQETGFLAYRARKAAFGNVAGRPVPTTRDEMFEDMRVIGNGVIVNAEGWELKLEQNKQAYFDQLATSARFTTLYPQSMTPEAYVDALNQNAGGALSPGERDALVAELKSSARTRAQVLRAVAEDVDLTRAEFNKAFVLMQFFGYLRRNPNSAPDTDFSGYNFWLGKLNEFGGDYIRAEMVKAFIESIEYRKRFGQ
ncbi:MAG TPA: DUF4214 domain-containing protein [Pyrinomonadaceae bacterium]|jgi:hypothetical protein